MFNIKNEYKVIDDYVIIYLNSKKYGTKEAIIDLDDLEKLLNFKYTWYPVYYKKWDTFYCRCSVYNGMKNGKGTCRMLYLSQFVLGIKGGRVRLIDHINHNTLDERKKNLRPLSTSDNSCHRNKLNSNNKSGYRNVSWNNKIQKWIVQLQVNGKNKVLGKFPKDKLDEAGVFAEEMRKLYYKEFAGSV